MAIVGCFVLELKGTSGTTVLVGLLLKQTIIFVLLVQGLGGQRAADEAENVVVVRPARLLPP